jgi:membrane-bound metal-dependent hydrolase YbcI (DUF457 family)
MLIKTHVAITIFFVLLFFSVVEHKVSFVIVALLATFIADVDSQYSWLGKYKFFRFLQFFVKHRTIFHSFTFLILLTVFFVLFFPILAFPFFLGYASHLIVDSFTISGIRPFYPVKAVSSGKVRTGGKVETGIFVGFVLVDVFMILFRFFNIL